MSEPTELRVPLSAALAEAVRRLGMYEAWRIDEESRRFWLLEGVA